MVESHASHSCQHTQLNLVIIVTTQLKTWKGLEDQFTESFVLIKQLCHPYQNNKPEAISSHLIYVGSGLSSI